MTRQQRKREARANRDKRKKASDPVIRCPFCKDKLLAIRRGNCGTFGCPGHIAGRLFIGGAA
jgi:hypothetical protein